MVSLISHLVKLEHIDIRELLAQPVSKDDAIPDEWTELVEGPDAPHVVSTLVVDKNDVPLIVHLPKFLSEASHVGSLYHRTILKST